MAVRQFLVYTITSPPRPYISVATDGEDVRVAFADWYLKGHSRRRSLLRSTEESFKRKLAGKTPVTSEDPVDRLKTNMMSFFSDVEIYPSFEKAQAAAQEALDAGN